MMLAFELGLGVLAIVLALAFGLKPWQALDFGPSAWLLAVLATLPMAAMLPLLARSRWAWVEELRRFMRTVVVPLFASLPNGALLLVALAAGVGEELLFRGVLQAGLSGWLGPLPGLLLASLAFALVHAVSRAYFLLSLLAGLYLGLIFLWTGNLLVVILVHFLYDWVALHWWVRGPGAGPPAEESLAA